MFISMNSITGGPNKFVLIDLNSIPGAPKIILIIILIRDGGVACGTVRKKDEGRSAGLQDGPTHFCSAKTF